VAAFGIAMGSIALLIWTSAFISLGVAIVTAVGWCLWLERHPLT